MNIKKITVVLISVLMLLSSFTLVFAADTVTLSDQVSISNVVREEAPMYLEGVPVYVCQAPVTVTLLKDSTSYTVADIVVDDEGGFFPSVGYLHDNGTHEEYWSYEKNHAFPKGLVHTLTDQTNPFYVKSTASGKTAQAIILIAGTQPINTANKVEQYEHALWSEPVTGGTMTIRGLYDVTYNKNGDKTFVIDTQSTITVNRAVSAIYVDNTLCTEATDLCTAPVYTTGIYQDNQFWYDEQSPITSQTYILPGATLNITAPGDHTVTVSLGYQSKDERTAIQSGENLSWQTSPRIFFRVLNANPTANYTSSKVLINGIETAFEAYNIEDNNYFKLRDIAKVLSGTEKQFEVTWNDETRAIDLISGEAYTPVGGELAPGNGEAKPSSICTSRIYKDGAEVVLRAYNINGNNYFKLRDLGQAFDFDVSWNGAENCITIETDKSYTAD